MPQLYGGPRYTRPPRHREPTRPFDPDDLPLEAHRSRSDQELLAEPRTAFQTVADDVPEPVSFLRRALSPFGRHTGR